MCSETFIKIIPKINTGTNSEKVKVHENQKRGRIKNKKTISIEI